MSKLKGIGANKESRSRLPNLVNTTDAYAEDLIYAIEEILEPKQEIQETKSWGNSRLRILAASSMLERLQELGQKDLVI